MEGLKEDTAFRLKGLETKEQFIAQNTQTPSKGAPTSAELGKHDKYATGNKHKFRIGNFFCGKIAFEQMLESFQLRLPQQPRSRVRVAFV